MSTPNSLRDVKDDAKERLSTDLEQLKNSFLQFKKDVSHILGNAVGVGKSSARGGVDAVRDGAHAAADQVRDGYEDLKNRSSDQLDRLTHCITEKPVASALIAFGVGFVIAKALMRK